MSTLQQIGAYLGAKFKALDSRVTVVENNSGFAATPEFLGSVRMSAEYTDTNRTLTVRWEDEDAPDCTKVNLHFSPSYQNTTGVTISGTVTRANGVATIQKSYMTDSLIDGIIEAKVITWTFLNGDTYINHIVTGPINLR